MRRQRMVQGELYRRGERHITMRLCIMPLVAAVVLAVSACGAGSRADDLSEIEVLVAGVPAQAVSFDPSDESAKTTALAATVFGQPHIEITFEHDFERVNSATAYKVNGACHEITVSCGISAESSIIFWPWDLLNNAPERNQLPFEIQGQKVTLVSSLTSGTQVVVLEVEVDGSPVSYGLLLNYLPVEG